MSKYPLRLALCLVSLTFITGARSGDLPVELKFGVHVHFPVTFEVDGKFTCSTPGEHSEFVCLFADTCEGNTADACTEVELEPGPHTVTVTWNDQSMSWKVKLQHIDADPDPDFGGPEEYFNSCQFHLAADGTPVLDCNIK